MLLRMRASTAGDPATVKSDSRPSRDNISQVRMPVLKIFPLNRQSLDCQIPRVARNASVASVGGVGGVGGV